MFLNLITFFDALVMYNFCLNIDQLDGLRVNKKKHSSMEDYLQLPDDYDDRKCEPGKKRVSLFSNF